MELQAWKIWRAERPSTEIRSPGETQTGREGKNRFQLEHTEREAAECGPHGGAREASGGPGPASRGSHRGIAVIAGISTLRFPRDPLKPTPRSSRPSRFVGGGSLSPASPPLHTRKHARLRAKSQDSVAPDGRTQFRKRPTVTLSSPEDKSLASRPNQRRPGGGLSRRFHFKRSYRTLEMDISHGRRMART